MRMTRVNITIPADLLRQARERGLNVSRVAAAALADELDRRARVDALDSYLRELDAELGPVSHEERLAAERWADRELGAPEHAGGADVKRTG